MSRSSRNRRKGSRGAAQAPAPQRARPLRTLLLLALGVGLGWLAATVVPGPLRPSTDAVVESVPPVTVRIGTFRGSGGGVEVAPADGGADTLLILYPGGRVRPQAYTWLGVALAPVGVRTLIPAMPLDLAALGRDRAGALIAQERDGERLVVVGGHSLGGAMAASWLARNPDGADALVLMGAYPAAGDDLSGLDLPTLVLAAEHDGLATLADVEEGLGRLPPRAGMEIIDGAVHAFFGRYGPQRGDGLPTVTRARAESEIAGSVEAFLASLR